MSGKFRKEIIRLGKYVLPDDPSKTIDVTLERMEKWIADTKAAGVKTWVPYRHSRDPRDNCGFVPEFEVADGIMYGTFDITDEETAKKIEEGTIRDVSISVGPVVKEDGTEYPEVIRHVALVMDPHVREQGDFAAMEAAKGGFCFSASDRVNENLFRKFMNWLKREEGGEDLDEETKKRYAKMEVEFEAAKEKTLEMEGKIDELNAKFEAANTELEESKARVAEFEAADAERQKAEQERFEAEAGQFAERLVSEMKEGAEPAKVEDWKGLYLTNKDLAMAAAGNLGIKFEGEVDGEPKERPKQKASEKDPLVAEVLKQMDYDDVDGMMDRHGGEE